MSQSSGLGSRRAARMAAWICALAPLLTACDGPAVAPAPPPPEVGVIQVTPRTQPLTFEVIGDIRAYQEVELRPRVSGVVEKQLFRPGQMVKQGAPLFVMDTRSLDSAIARRLRDRPAAPRSPGGSAIARRPPHHATASPGQPSTDPARSFLAQTPHGP